MSGIKYKYKDIDSILELLKTVLKDKKIEFEIEGPKEEDGNYIFVINYRGEKFSIAAWDDIPLLYIMKVWPAGDNLDIDDEYLILHSVNEVNLRNPPKVVYSYSGVGDKRELYFVTTQEIYWLPGIPAPDEHLISNLDCMNKSQEIFNEILMENRIGGITKGVGKKSPYIA